MYHPGVDHKNNKNNGRQVISVPKDRRFRSIIDKGNRSYDKVCEKGQLRMIRRLDRMSLGRTLGGKGDEGSHPRGVYSSVRGLPGIVGQRLADTRTDVVGRL